MKKVFSYNGAFPQKLLHLVSTDFQARIQLFRDIKEMKDPELQASQNSLSKINPKNQHVQFQS